MSDNQTIFEQDWWYDAATDGQWQQVEFNDGTTFSAKLIFSIYRERGFTTIGMPPMARVMKPVITFHSTRPKTDLPYCLRAISGLTEQLPKSDRFTYTLPPGCGLDLPFCLAGYTVSVTHTFRTDPASGHDPWKQMDQKVRYNIKHGLRRTSVDRHDDIERYIRLSSTFLRDRAFTDIMNYEAIRRIWHACRARDQAAIFSCVDAQGQDLAAAIVIWDEKHLYYWLNCRDPETNDYTANSILIWTAIELAQSQGLIFDMDGFGTLNAGVFLSRFGLIPSQRYNVSRVSDTAQLRTAIASQMRKAIGPRLRKQLLDARNVLTARRAPVARQLPS